jgi:2-polyprenyl-3-methyl-5-hydroxy-6-metoxy-1,4-benzoquinol methylase
MSPMQARPGHYWSRCGQCGFLRSSLQPAFGVSGALDEARRSHALEDLRRASFESVLDRLSEISPRRPAAMLDVGSAHGWFLQAASRRGYRAMGIEPDAAMAEQSRQAGCDVVDGYFPRDLPEDLHFDVISFNDVFEHLPDPRAAAAACFQRLNPGGMLAITLPSSKGALFRIARLLDAIGLHRPFDRMWQRGFPSPHLSYFHPEGLATMLADTGFDEVYAGQLPSFTRTGLWQRLRFDHRSSWLGSAVMFAPLYLLAGMFSLLPADLSVQVFRRR